jgi:uncharacterized protein (DUF1800 family)
MAGGTLKIGEPVLRQPRFDGGSKTFLGKTGAYRPDDIVDIIAEQPAAAAYIVRRLFSFFVYPDPDEKALKPFVTEYDKSGGSIGAVVQSMLRSDVFYSPRAYRAIIKSPVEYAIGALKALGLQANAPQLVAGLGARGGVLANMGQIPMEPPNVAGWPGNEAWLNSATMFARLNLINLVTSGNMSQRRPQAQQSRNQGPVTSMPLGSTGQSLEYLLPLVLDDNLSDESRQVLADYGGGLDSTLSPNQLRGLAYLVLASPQFHLS